MSEKIWEKWEEHYTAKGIDIDLISRDGILNDQCYSETRPKILFILKDTNDFVKEHREEQDLRIHLKDGPAYQMWHAVARWAAGILKGFPPYEDIDNSATLKDSLSRVAAINLKKVTGKSSADMTTINAYAHMDRDLLVEQIKMINPDIIVACGVFDPLIWLLDLNVHSSQLNQLDEPVSSSIIPAWVIPFRHPARVDSRATYEKLGAKVRQIRR